MPPRPRSRTARAALGSVPALLVSFLLLAVLPPALGAVQGPVGPPARGASDPILEIVEFSDFQCPYCAGSKPVLDSLLVHHPGEVRIVYRHYPLPMHAHAERAAVASVEAARQGAFWPYHDLLFTHQGRLSDADLLGYADSLGLDRQGFVLALAGDQHAAAVAADVALGRSLGVVGTPTFYVNGYRLVGVPPLWVFEEALQAFRARRAEARSLVPTTP